MLYGGLQLRDTDSVQANTNSLVFMAHASTVVPRPFLFPRKWPGVYKPVHFLRVNHSLVTISYLVTLAKRFLEQKR